MKRIIAAVMLLALCALAAVETRYAGDGTPRHSLTVSTVPIKLVEVSGFNNRGTDTYILVLRPPITNGVAALTNGLVPVAVDLAFAGLPYVKRFQEPLNLDSCVVAASTTFSNLTITTGTANVTFTAVYGGQ